MMLPTGTGNRGVWPRTRGVWAKTPRARVAHHYSVCVRCQGRGWLLSEPYGLFGLAIDPEPCVTCGGRKGEYDDHPYGGTGYVVACGRQDYSHGMEESPDARRCQKCEEALRNADKHPSEMTLDELYDVGRAQWMALLRSGMSEQGVVSCTRTWADALVEHQGIAPSVGEALKRRLIS